MSFVWTFYNLSAFLSKLKFECHISINTRNAQASLRHSDRCLHYDDCSSTSVICDVQQWWHRLACPSLDVVLPWFRRSSSVMTTIHCSLLYDFWQRIMATDMAEPLWRLTVDSKSSWRPTRISTCCHAMDIHFLLFLRLLLMPDRSSSFSF